MNNEAKTVKEVLIAARWILEHNEWGKHDNCLKIDGKYYVCGQGAIREVLATSALRCDAIVLCDKHVRMISNNTYFFTFNDFRATCKEDVLDVFDAVIKGLK